MNRRSPTTLSPSTPRITMVCIRLRRCTVDSASVCPITSNLGGQRPDSGRESGSPGQGSGLEWRRTAVPLRASVASCACTAGVGRIGPVRACRSGRASPSPALSASATGARALSGWSTRPHAS